MRAQEAHRILATLGLPADAPWDNSVRPGTHFGPQWAAFNVSDFGLRVAPPPPPPWPWPFFATRDGRGWRVVQVWRRRVWRVETPLYAELLWTPATGGRIAIHGLEDGRPGQLNLIKPALSLLVEVDKGGRPLGSGVLQSPDGIRTAYERLRAVDGKCKGPTQSKLAEELSVDLATLQRAIKSLGLPWPIS